MAIKQTLIDFSKALKSAIQVQKNVTDIAADYLDKLSDENFDGVTPEEMEEVTGDLDDLTTTAKTNLVAAINEVNGVAGDLGDLETTDKTDLVSAINEVNAAVADKGSVKVTGDGVKTYTEILAELFALIDYTKVTRDTYLVDANLIGQLMCNRPDTHELTFVSCTGNVFYNYTVGSATSAMRSFRLSDQSYVDLGNAVVTNGLELVIHY